MPVNALSKPGLAARVKDLLTRQIAWFEHLLSALESIDADLEGPESAAWAERSAAHADGMARLDQEFRELTREWESASGVSESDRAEVRELAKRAEALANQLGAVHERTLGLIGEQADSVKAALDETRRGRALLGKYYAGGPAEAAFLDKKA